MYRSLAALLTTWSMASRMKFMVITSTMGRSPAIAAPTPAPTTTDSDIGVSLTRCSPYFLPMPRVTAYGPW
jgi:hypothetical protein